MMLNWSDLDTENLIEEHGDWLALADGEIVEYAAKSVRDFFIFTDRRLIIADVQGLVRKKTEYQSIPYRSISRWSAESKGKGLFDGADLKVWLGANSEPTFEVELKKDKSAADIMTLLSTHAL
jgi:hypothetical protein